MMFAVTGGEGEQAGAAERNPRQSREGGANIGGEALLRETMQHRTQALRHLLLLEIATLTVMALLAYLNARVLHAAIMAGFVVLSALLAPFLLRYRDRPGVHAGFVTLVAAALLWALASGGAENSGQIWILIFPAFSLYMLGLRRGIVASLLLAGVASLLFVLIFRDQLPAEYRLATTIRVLALYFIALALSVIYERARQKSFRSVHLASRTLSHRASTDELTGLFNRRAMDALVPRDGTPVALIMMDIDHFKEINDSYGHAAGDAVLIELAQRLRTSLRRDDIVARWGGEEFLVALPGTDGIGGYCVAEQLRERVQEAPFRIPAAAPETETTVTSCPLTASFGVAHLDEAESFAGCIRLADERLYGAKRAGRNEVHGPQVLAGCE